MKHIPVMLEECIQALNINPQGIYVDATFGYGGHSTAILKQLTSGKLYVIDADTSAIETAKALQQEYPDTLEVIFDNYANIAKRLAGFNVSGVDGILVDCGVSSMQLDEAERGFSYRFDAKLDMRMNQTQALDAFTIVNTYPPEALLDILYRYGEEKFAKGIVKEIIKTREIQPIETTFQLVDVIKKGYPIKALSKKGHPAKQTFQALRIAVNDELQSLNRILEDGLSLLNPHGVMAIITFHSLEDRMVKNAFKEKAVPPKTNKRIPLKEVSLNFELVSKKAILPSEEELNNNPRSASAKLRVIQRKG